MEDQDEMDESYRVDHPELFIRQAFAACVLPASAFLSQWTKPSASMEYFVSSKGATYIDDAFRGFGVGARCHQKLKGGSEQP
jgi:hypothetical protein